jgi:hypothetical protein
MQEPPFSGGVVSGFDRRGVLAEILEEPGKPRERHTVRVMAPVHIGPGSRRTIAGRGV